MDEQTNTMIQGVPPTHTKEKPVKRWLLLSLSQNNSWWQQKSSQLNFSMGSY